jgi:hypothetical protein
MPGQQVALLVQFTNQGLGEFLIQVPQTAPGGGAMRGLRSSTGAPIAKAERDTIATGIERAANSAKDLNMRLGIEPCNRYVTHLVKYGPTVGCVDGTHW